MGPVLRRNLLNRSTPILADPGSSCTLGDSAPANIRAALIGYGRWGVNVARNAGRFAGCGLVAIADPSSERLDQARRNHPDAAAHADWRAVVRDASIDAVLIATPADTHYDLAHAALAASKHVFVEKPMTASAREARMLVELAAKRDRVLMVDHTYVFSPAVQAIAATLAAGAIGRPLAYVSSRHNAGGVRGDASVHWDLAAHDLAILGHLFARGPHEVVATRLDGGQGERIGVRLVLAYPDAFTATIESSWTAPAKARRVAISGAAGRIDYDDLAPERKVRVRTHGGDIEPLLGVVEPLYAALIHFAACIDGRAAPQADGRAGLEVVRLLEAADRSLASGGHPVVVASRVEAA